MSVVITVQCITCDATKRIDEAQSARLTAEKSVPMCDHCYMPMVAIKAARAPDAPPAEDAP